MKKDKEYFESFKKKMGWTTREKGKLQLSRTALNEYREKFGVDYTVPEGAEIIEDLII